MPEPLSVLERRVLGVLVEKALTAAAPEPLSLNAIVIGCNQKSNRDPLMSLEEPEVDTCLEKLQRKGCVFRVTGGRVERWRHNLYDNWKVTKPELAFIGELLLRGPQSAAEARARASRMEPIDNDSATGVIRHLVELGFVIWLMPEDRRGATLTHGFHSPEELGRLKSTAASGPRHDEIAPAATASTPAPLPTPPPDNRLEQALVDIATLKKEVGELRAMVVNLQESLGITATP